jgi:hypothetical protein
MSDDDFNDYRDNWTDFPQRAETIHRETQTALQIVLSCKTFEPGKFVRSETWTTDWKRVE